MAVGNIFHYASWAPYGSTVSDKELGINEAVASAIGIIIQIQSLNQSINQ